MKEFLHKWWIADRGLPAVCPNIQPFRWEVLLPLTALFLAMAVVPVWAEVETFVVGRDVSWEAWGTLDALTEQKVWIGPNVADSTWCIRPEEADSTVNMLSALYAEGRFLVTNSTFTVFINRTGGQSRYNPRRDGVIWCPKMDWNSAKGALMALVNGSGLLVPEGTDVRLRGGLMVGLPEDAANAVPWRMPNNTDVMLGDGTVLSLRPNTSRKNVDARLLRTVEAMRDTTCFDFFNRSITNDGIEINVLLPASLPVSRIRFFPLFFQGLEDLYMKGFEIYSNDGSRETQDEKGNPIYSLFHASPGNREPIVDLARPVPEYMRYVTLKSTAADPFVIDQLEIYGSGFVREALYSSNIIDLGAVANLGRIRWGQRKDPNTSLRVRTRVGTDNTVFVFTRLNEIGEYVPLDGNSDATNLGAWNALTAEAKGPIYEDTENWSLWSVPYDSSGQELVAEGPRRFVQFTVSLESEVASNRAEVDSLSIEFSRPVMASVLWGQIDPRRDIELGKATPFRYSVQATIGGDDTGFDTIEILTPARATLDSVRIGNTALSAADYTTTGTGDRLFRVHFPSHPIAQTDSLQLVFRSEVLSFGTSLGGRVSASWLGKTSLSQRIEQRNPGDLSVQGLEASLGKVLADAGIAPNPITPNNDGVNDLATISFTLFQVKGAVPVEAALYALSGELVWKKTDSLAVGRHEMSWDGRGQEGARVPPGVYLYRILVKGDEREFVKVGTVVVVY
ncbi:MAG: gliding motility-associated C-terminal domain-containing protein [Candidatus Latescibacterota bacterium]